MDYNNKNLINPLAENRWKAILHVGRTMKVSEKISFELMGDVRFHGTNNDFGPASATLKQKPLWEFQSHLRYLFTPGTFVGAMVSHVMGGETRVNGIDQDDRQSLNKVLFSVGHMIRPDMQVIGSIGQDLSIRSGLKEEARFNLRFLKIY